MAEWIASGLVEVTATGGPFWLLIGIGLTTTIMNGFISNNACMVLMFPVCLAANQLAPDVSLKKMVCVMMMAGSTGTRVRFSLGCSHGADLVLRKGVHAWVGWAVVRCDVSVGEVRAVPCLFFVWLFCVVSPALQSSAVPLALSSFARHRLPYAHWVPDQLDGPALRQLKVLGLHQVRDAPDDHGAGAGGRHDACLG